MEIGLRFGLFEEIAKHPQGIKADDFAMKMGYDPLYTQVWCRSAYGAEVLDLGEQQTFKLAPHMETLLLDIGSPGYLCGLPAVLTQPEMFDGLAQNLESGNRIWWDQTSPAWIQGVSGTGLAFYNRLVPGGLSRVPGLDDKLAGDARVVDLSCGAGYGLVRMAHHYPKCSLVGVDGDAYSLEIAKERLDKEGIQGQIGLVHSSLEELEVVDQYDVVVNNISMHECRDIEKATANIYRSLKQDGYFVISDFLFPESTEDCRTVPARIMSGIQFFEATIDDQLLPVKAYMDLLNRHGFTNVGVVELTPVHALTYGQRQQVWSVTETLLAVPMPTEDRQAAQLVPEEGEMMFDLHER